MPLQAKLAEFVAKAGLKDDVAKWLETTGYVTYEDVASSLKIMWTFRMRGMGIQVGSMS